jgi:hypothetical protein
MKNHFLKSHFLNSLIIACGLFAGVVSHAAVVTIEGAIDKIVPEKREIYVLSEGKKHEFYFTEKTEIVKAGQPVSFETLKKSGKVKVTADKIGKRLDPLKVEILD